MKGHSAFFILLCISCATGSPDPRKRLVGADVATTVQQEFTQDPDNTHHPQDHTHHPQDHTHHHPGHTHHPPGHGTHPPDHGTHPPGHPPGDSHHMEMFFRVSEHVTILFEEWHTMTYPQLAGSCIGIAVIAILYEGFKFLRDWLESKRRERYNPKHSQHHVHPEEAKAGSSGYPLTVGEPPKVRPWDLIHIIQSFLHIIQLFVSYCLMLVVMTYNAYLVLAVCLGGAIGYFCFSWKKFTVQDPNECCN